MNNKHTPGPWYCFQPKDSPRQITDGHMRICTMTNRSDEIANAKLITAAPELLAALEIALERLNFANLSRKAKDGHFMVSDLEAAIQKATKP